MNIILDLIGGFLSPLSDKFHRDRSAIQVATQDRLDELNNYMWALQESSTWRFQIEALRESIDLERVEQSTEERWSWWSWEPTEERIQTVDEANQNISPRVNWQKEGF